MITTTQLRPRHLLIDPLLDGLVATFYDGFPIVVFRQRVAFDGANITHLENSPVVRQVAEAVEDLACHVGPF